VIQYSEPAGLQLHWIFWRKEDISYLKCPHWCAQIREDLSNEGIKNLHGQFLSTLSFYIELSEKVNFAKQSHF
jgi:hypothetical protein